MGGVVAYGKYEIQRRCAGGGEFVPGFTAQSIGGKILAPENFQRQRIDLTGGIAAGAIGTEPTLAVMVQQRLRENAAGRVAGAQKQHMEEGIDILHGLLALF